MKKRRHVYVVLCNKEPMIYNICSSYKKAQEYADSLVNDRKTQDGFYHTHYGPAGVEAGERLRFSVCIKGGHYDSCFIQVKQFPLR